MTRDEKIIAIYMGIAIVAITLIAVIEWGVIGFLLAIAMWALLLAIVKAASTET